MHPGAMNPHHRPTNGCCDRRRLRRRASALDARACPSEFGRVRHMSAGTRDSWYLRHRLAFGAGGVYLVVAVLSTVGYLADRHEYSIPALILVYASFPVHWILYKGLHPQMAHIERLPHGEIIGLALLIALTALLYFGVVQVLACSIKSARCWLAREPGP